MFADVGDIPIQDIRNLGVSEERIMNFISDSVKIVMNHVYLLILYFIFMILIT